MKTGKNNYGHRPCPACIEPLTSSKNRDEVSGPGPGPGRPRDPPPIMSVLLTKAARPRARPPTGRVSLPLIAEVFQVSRLLLNPNFTFCGLRPAANQRAPLLRPAYLVLILSFKDPANPGRRPNQNFSPDWSSGGKSPLSPYLRCRLYWHGSW